MKVSCSWLNELVPIKTDITELSERLSVAGFEVEEIIEHSKRAQGVVIGFVNEISKHPKADKLNICNVDIGSENIQIVCGASNIKSNIHVLVAVEGAYLSSINLKIKETTIRGVKSNGMICSLREIGFNTQIDGIAILEDLYQQIPRKGTSAIELLGLNDTILDLAITANRPDGMSIIGIAREISALTKTPLNLPDDDNLTTFKEFEPSIIDYESIGINGIYSTSYISGVDGSDSSPSWLKTKLVNLGINPINLIVDITNYLMLEQGQPLHAFDADKLNKLTNKTVIPGDFGIRKATNGEEFISLDEKEYKLNEQITVITCSNIPIAIAGVIGGINSSVTVKTKRIWLEGAVFAQTTVRTSVKEIGIRTESSSRFEKGISSRNTLKTVNRAYKLFTDHFKIDESSFYVNSLEPQKSLMVKLRRQRIHKILGPLINHKQNETSIEDIDRANLLDNIYVHDTDIVNILDSLGCNHKSTEYGWLVEIPLFRELDLIREIDLIEEIARLIGYDKFQSNIPEPLSPGSLNPNQYIERKIKNDFCITGFQEVLTSSLVSTKDVDKNHIAISNPLLFETSVLRTDLWKEHINILKRNIDNGSTNCWIFEIGKVYTNEKQFNEQNFISGLIYGKRKLSCWSRNDKEIDLDYYSARGKLEQALSGTKVKITDRKMDDSSLLHPGKSVELIIEGKICGYFGEIHPILADLYKIPNRSYLFKIELDKILQAATRLNKLIPSFKDYPVVPFMERDISIIISNNIKCAEVISTINKAGKPLIEKVELIDIYQGDNLADEKISHSYRIRYRNPETTLTDEEINPYHEKIISALSTKLLAELRK